MSFTNQTQHYGLPQYIGTDVPAYLTDYNGAMATIDQGMNAAKTQADAAATAAGQAANDISALNSTVQTQATQISAAAQAASNAQSTANTADGKAGELDTRVTALETGGVVKTVDVSFSETMKTWVSGITIAPTPINLLNKLPSGKTIDDVLSVTVINPNNVCWAVTNAATVSIVSVLANVTISGTVRIAYK